MSKDSVAHILMRHGGTEHHKDAHDKFSTARPGKYARGGFAEGGDTDEEKMRHGGRRHHGRHRAEGGDTYSEGGESMRRGGHRRRRAEGGANVNPQTGHPQYGLLGQLPLIGPLLSGLAGQLFAQGGFAEGGMRRGGRRRRAEGGYDEGGETMKHGGHRRRRSMGGSMMGSMSSNRMAPLDAMGRTIPPIGSSPMSTPMWAWDPKDFQAAMANYHQQYPGYATGGYADGGETMRRGGRRRRAEGGYDEGGETMRRGGRRHRADGGDTIPVEGKARANAMGGAQFARSPLGGNRPFSEGGETMRHGGHRRRHHAEGGYDD